MKLGLTFISVVLATLLTACGGGGDSSTASGAACLPTMANPDACVPVLKMSLADATGAPITTVTPSLDGVLQASVTDSTGKGVSGVVVTFSTTDKKGVLVPNSGTALTDTRGIAQVKLPAGSQAGAFTVTASATVAQSTLLNTLPYQVAFPTVTLSPLTITPATLSAGGNASISVDVLSNGAVYTPPQSVTFTSPCIAAGKAIIGTPVQTQAGTATASYTDKGCGTSDVITASTSLGDLLVTRTGSITVAPASVGALQFVSADTTNIALKGTGGSGRQEFSTLKFKVFDTTGTAVSGKSVTFDFASAAVGGLTLFPKTATSAADGTVTTLVSNGTIPTSVRVIASIGTVQTLSNILVISTGVPDDKHFSLASSVGNCEGLNFDQTCATITATLGDHFGNPVPDGTAVSFTAEGGVIDASCVTGSLPPPGATPAGQTTNSKVGPGSGTCSVILRASSPRPAGGRVVVMAYVLGEETFLDNNGNNVFDAGDTILPVVSTNPPVNGLSPDIFRDDNEDGVWNPGEPCIGPNLNGSCSTPRDSVYNGVLANPRPATFQTTYLSRQLVEIFSGSNATIQVTPAALTCAAGGSAAFQVNVRDVNGNLMPAGSTIALTSVFGRDPGTVIPSSIAVPAVTFGIGDPMLIPSYSASVGCPGGAGQLNVTVTTPAGVTSTLNVPVN